MDTQQDIYPLQKETFNRNGCGRKKASYPFRVSPAEIRDSVEPSRIESTGYDHECLDWRMADYLSWTFTTARVTQEGNTLRPERFVLLLNRVVFAVSSCPDERVTTNVAIEDLILGARTKFMEFYRRLAPETRNDSRNVDETS
ncbi:hypothetical protein AVEN_107011-1 [Araneus ventricosus]|uniref:Uncharacterized protein n=1 Tax=Araneus ventricosus TaxID=182803 RepID=A0A4Y2RUD5_ARAVE|nr:hypothetical protein AVEN_107011-1 [Araneus ventricosus]